MQQVFFFPSVLSRGQHAFFFFLVFVLSMPHELRRAAFAGCFWWQYILAASAGPFDWLFRLVVLTGLFGYFLAGCFR